MSQGPQTPRLAPLPEPEPRRGLRKALLISLVAMLAVAGVTWLFVRPDDPRPPCCTETARVTDATTGLSYPLPEGWNAFREGQFVQDFTSGAGTETENPGAQVWTFTIPGWGGDAEAAAEEAARTTSGFFYAAVPETWKFLSSEPWNFDGVEAYEVSWTASHPEYDAPIYGRQLQILSSDGSATFLFGFAYPDDEALRDEIDWIFANTDLN